MSWNIFKWIVELDQQVKDLTDFNGDHSRWLKELQDKLSELEKANQVLVTSNQVLIRRQENIGERVKDIAHELVTQSRNPQIYALEQQIKELLGFINDKDRRIEAIEVKLKKVGDATFIHSVQLNSQYSEVPPMPSLADEEKERKRQYQREWYAKKQAKLKREKNVQAAREKKNAYHRAYYARKKGAKNA
jgi:hypothetical protein